MITASAVAIAIGAHVGTWHEKPGYNDFNPGLFYSVTVESPRDAWTARTGIALGVYHNSIRRTSAWTAWHAQSRELSLTLNLSVRGELSAGVVTGYARPIQPLLVPGLAFTYTGLDRPYTLHVNYLPQADPKTGTQAVNISVSTPFGGK